MKCIRCDNDSKYPDRKERKCPKCGGLFAFEPKDGDKVTDMLFKKAIDAVSANGSLRWGVEHLYYEICRRKKVTVPTACVVVPALLCLGLTVVALFGKPAFFLMALGAFLIAGGTLIARLMSGPLVKVTEDDFTTWWKRYRETHGDPPGLIVRQPQPTMPQNLEADIGDYSFDRAVICDRARTVDLLLANNFHFENNCAVLSIDGYPKGPFETVRAMLKRNPRLEVFALHDATLKGCELAHVLANDPAWFGGQVKVVDVGLRPGHAGPFKGLLQPSTTRIVTANSFLTAAEAEWLSEYALELAAVRPEQVLKRLFRAIQRKGTEEESTTGVFVHGGGDGGGGGGVETDFASFNTDAGAGDGGGDSFG